MQQSYAALEQRVRELEKKNTELKQKGSIVDRRLIDRPLPVEDNQSITFEDLFQIADIQKIQDEFAKATNVASIITHVDGTPITKQSNFCRLCRDIIRKTEKGSQNCLVSDATIGRFHQEGPIVQPCMSGGLYDAGAGIVVGGKHIANWLIGQVRNELQTEEQMLEYAREIGADEQEMLEAFREVPVMPRRQFELIAQFLFTMANQLSKIAYQNVQMSSLIAELRKTDNALREKEEILESIHIAAPIGIAIFVERQFIWVNKKFAQMVNYSEAELLNKSTRMLYPNKEEFDVIGQDLNRQIADKGVGSAETCWQNKGGELVDVLINVTSFGQNDSRQEVICTVLDISERKRTEVALLESEERFRLAFKTSPDAMAIS